jgi:menaquinone-dependent protoporphyrinogen oxidase
MANILILYSTVDGHTRQICERLREVVEHDDHRATVIPVDETPVSELASFDKIVIGASIRYGKHRPAVAEFINANQPVLETRPSAFFTVNAVARKPEKRRPETNPYLQKFLKQIHWKPAHLGVFAGKIDYSKYGFVDKTMIRFIMWITKGPTDPDAVVEFTDWDDVAEFGRLISRM